jgi:hypothetical protein
VKAYRIALFSLLILALSLSVAFAQIPNINAAILNSCTGMSVNAVQSGNTFTYSLTVDPSATFNGFPVLAVRDFIVYPNAGADATGPT